MDSLLCPQSLRIALLTVPLNGGICDRLHAVIIKRLQRGLFHGILDSVMLQGIGGGIGMCFDNVSAVLKSLYSVLRYNELQSVAFANDFSVILSSNAIEANVSMAEDALAMELFAVEDAARALQCNHLGFLLCFCASSRAFVNDYGNRLRKDRSRACSGGDLQQRMECSFVRFQRFQGF